MDLHANILLPNTASIFLVWKNRKHVINLNVKTNLEKYARKRTSLSVGGAGALIVSKATLLHSSFDLTYFYL